MFNLDDVSQSISKNMLKDINKDGYANDDPSTVPSDIKLANRDQEIDFGDDDNEKDSAPAASSKPGPKMGGTIEPKDADF